MFTRVLQLGRTPFASRCDALASYPCRDGRLRFVATRSFFVAVATMAIDKRAAYQGAGNPAWREKVERICGNCGRSFMVVPSRVVRGEGKFCSKACALAAKTAEVRVGNCYECGQRVVRRRSQAHGKRLFCSIACRGKAQSREIGPDARGWRGGPVIVKCGHCDAPIKREPNQVALRAMQFCGYRCHAAWQSEHQRGADNPAWKGGATALRRKGGQAHLVFWTRTIKDRAGRRCEHCGARHQLHAHHIFPYAEFPALREDANNGICLCRKCHRAAHRGQIVPQRRMSF